MKAIRDIDIGVVLKDKDGDIWVRVRGGAMIFVRSRSEKGSVGFWRIKHLAEAERKFGPFVVFDPATLCDRDDDEEDE